MTRKQTKPAPGQSRDTLSGSLVHGIKANAQSAGSILVLLILFVLCSIFINRFIQFDNIRSILYSASLLAIAAIGESMVLLTGNYDLSVGSVIGLTAYVVYDMTSHSVFAGYWIVVFAILFGLVLGAFNGWLVGYMHVPSMVATLGTLSVYRGICSLYAGPREVTKNQIPAWMNKFSPSSILGIPTYVWVLLVIVIALTWFLNNRPAGRHLYAYGSNNAAAPSFGLSGDRIVIGAYAASGAFAGVVGILMGAQVGTINSVLGNGYEMQVIAAAVIGGVSLWGGVGTPFGAMIGAVIYATLDNALVLLNVNEYYRLIFQGAAVIVAIGVDALVRNGVMKSVSRKTILEKVS